MRQFYSSSHQMNDKLSQHKIMWVVSYLAPCDVCPEEITSNSAHDNRCGFGAFRINTWRPCYLSCDICIQRRMHSFELLTNLPMKIEQSNNPKTNDNILLTWFNAGKTSRTICADGVPMMLRSRWRPNFLVNKPERFRRFRMYWPHKHLPCVTKSCVGTTTGNFHPMVLDNLRVTTSLTLLKRRRADIVFGSLSSDVVWIIGKLNLRLVSTTGNRSNAFGGNDDGPERVFASNEAAPSTVVLDSYTRSGESIFTLIEFFFFYQSKINEQPTKCL